MSPAVFYAVIVILFIIVVIVGIFAFWDWRAFLLRRIGPDYKKGLAHIQINGVWVYREAYLVFEGDDAMTYSREIQIDGKKTYVNDIVPNHIGFSYDEYTGARLYRVRPGGCIGFSDDGIAPSVDYPAELISSHVLDRTVSNYAASVNAEGGFNWKPVIIGILVVAAILAVMYFTGILHLPGQNTPQTTANQTTTQTTTQQLDAEHPGIVRPHEGE